MIELPKKIIITDMELIPGDMIQDIKLEFQEDRNANKTYYAFINKAAIMRIDEWLKTTTKKEMNQDDVKKII
jgi:hypothetical protein